MQTINKFQWKINKPNNPQITNHKQGLCGPGWLHFYTNPFLAVLLNPIHAHIQNPRLFECQCEGDILHESLKSGCTKMTLTKEIHIPEITIEQKIKFAIFSALEICQEQKFTTWAHNWLNNINRTYMEAYNIADSSKYMFYKHFPNYHAAYHAALAACHKDNPSNYLTNYHAAQAAYNADITSTSKIDFIEIVKNSVNYS